MKAVLRSWAILILFSAPIFATQKGVCVVRMSGGKVKKYGNCAEADKSPIVDDIRRREDAEINAKATMNIPKRITGRIYVNCSMDRSDEPHFWISRRNSKRDMSFADGVQICRKCRSVPAIIRTKRIADKISRAIRHLYRNKGTQGYWLGTTYNPETDKLSPPYSYVKWGTKSLYDRSTKIILVPSSFVGAVMFNQTPITKSHGVICWREKSRVFRNL